MSRNNVRQSRSDRAARENIEQVSLFDNSCADDNRHPHEEWDKDVARRALDELFTLARQYNSTRAFMKLMDFMRKFRFYSPFNAMLVHVQMEGAIYVAPAHRWAQDYQRRIKPGARPLVILQPMGPVMFVFDVSNTEPDDAQLPSEVAHPFDVRGGRIGRELTWTIENAKRDGIRITAQDAGSGSAGHIKTVDPGLHLDVFSKRNPKLGAPEYIQVPLRYDILLNSDHSPETRYATLAHELAHLYCGHLGTPNPGWWPDRRGLPHVIQEFEAESVCYLLCGRLGIDNPSEEYLAQYLKSNTETPPISLECLVKAAGLLEQMGRERLLPRKEVKR